MSDLSIATIATTRAVEVIRLVPYTATNYGMVFWSGRWPMSAGAFPPDHPVGGGHSLTMQFGFSADMLSFRARGYWASCYPEGDGFCFQPRRDQTLVTTFIDIRECFEWVMSNNLAYSQ
jgi:hypothetical protein